MTHVLETVMQNEIALIKNEPQYTVQWAIECTVHTPKENIKALFVQDYSCLRDYVNRFSDVLSVTPVFGIGTVNHAIMPFAKELECTVKLFPLSNQPEYVELWGINIHEVRYKAILYEDSISVIDKNSPTAGTRSVADTTDVASVRLQLVNPLQEAIRSKTFGGVIRGSNPIDAITAILTKYTREGITDKKYYLEGVFIDDGYDRTIREHIVIPHLTPVIRIPKFINETVGGTYPTGFNYYLQGKFWYLWSPFNTKKFAKAHRTMTVLNVPPNQLAQIERTFRLTPTQLIVLSTGESFHRTLTDKTLVNQSQGVRFVDATKVFDGVAKVTGNKLDIDASTQVNEFQNQLTETHNKPNLVKESDARITTAYFTELSKIAQAMGSFIQFTWENSVDNLIFPGMAVRFIYMEGTKARQVYGTVLATDSVYQSVNTGIINRKFANTTIVSLFVEDSVLDSTMQ